MINVRSDEGRCELIVNGSANTLGADTIIIVGNVYEVMKKQDPKSAELYKAMISKNIEIAFMSVEEFHNHAAQKRVDHNVKG